MVIFWRSKTALFVPKKGIAFFSKRKNFHVKLESFPICIRILKYLKIDYILKERNSPLDINFLLRKNDWFVKTTGPQFSMKLQCFPIYIRSQFFKRNFSRKQKTKNKKKVSNHPFLLKIIPELKTNVKITLNFFIIKESERGNGLWIDAGLGSLCCTQC